MLLLLPPAPSPGGYGDALGNVAKSAHDDLDGLKHHVTDPISQEARQVDNMFKNAAQAVGKTIEETTQAARNAVAEGVQTHIPQSIGHIGNKIVAAKAAAQGAVRNAEKQVGESLVNAGQSLADN